MLNGQQKTTVRMWCFFAVLLLIFAGVEVRLFYLQIYSRAKWTKLADEKTKKEAVQSGIRGEIFAADGTPLVVNQPAINVVVDATLIPQKSTKAPKSKTDKKADRLQGLTPRQQLASILSKTLDLDYDQIFEKLALKRPARNQDGSILLNDKGLPIMRPNRYSVIARNVPPQQRKRILSLLSRYGLHRPVLFSESSLRYYPNGRMLSNVLGYTDIESDQTKAVMGLERSADHNMRGTAGKVVYETARDGKKLFYGLHQDKAVQNGNNIYLTVNRVLQEFMEDELDKAVAELQPNGIYAIMVDPRTGKVLATAQRPTFDPNDRTSIAKGSTSFLLGTAIMEPGSIIKPFTIAKALDDGEVTPETEIDCNNGHWLYRGRSLTDSHPYKKQTVADGIRYSSNILVAKVALQMGKERVYNNLRKFGFGERTGFTMTSESYGLLAAPAKWDELTITRITIGYAIGVTPLQMVRAYCALANHGWLPRLQIIDHYQNPFSDEIINFSMAPPTQMFKKPDTCDKIVKMLTSVTAPGGTATKAAIKGYKVAGKTGTSQKTYADKPGYEPGKYFASFIGFVPAENPRFVMLVTVDEPPADRHFGGSVAAPIFRKIAERALKYLENSQPGK